MSSSPEFPSPSELISKGRSSIPSGSRANAIPDSMGAGFTKASSLRVLCQVQAPNKFTTSLHDPVEAQLLPISRPSEPPATKKRKLKGVETSGPESTIAVKLKAPRKRTTTTKTITVSEEAVDGAERVELAGVMKDKKPQAKKSKDEGQTTIKKGKVTKPISTKSRGKSSNATKTKPSVENSTMESEKPEELPEHGLLAHLADSVVDVADKADFHNGKAISRRREWTPVKDTLTGRNDLIAPVDKDSTPLKGGTITDDPRKNGFETLLIEFGCIQSIDKSSGLKHVRNHDGEAVTKRRKLEVLNIGICPPRPNNQLKRSKSPRKKPQTITEKATARFVKEDFSTKPSLLGYFSVPHTENPPNVAVTDLTAEPQPAKARRRTSPAKPSTKVKSGTVKPKKRVVEAPVPLSPKSALNATKDQDVLFGTSSQLAREESPTLIRDVQQAIKASESESAFVNGSGKGNSNAMSGDSTIPAHSLSASSRNLWSASTRDFEGSLFSVDVVDLADTPRAEARIPQSRDGFPTSKPSDRSIKSPNDFVQEIGDPGPSYDEIDALTNNSMPKSIAEAALRSRPRSRSPTKKKIDVAVLTSAQHATSTKERPDFESYTTAQLRKAVSDYGFKSIKKRDQMIGLVEKCWESANRVALQSLPANTNMLQVSPEKLAKEPISPAKREGKHLKIKEMSSTTDGASITVAAPKKTRGRPRKDTVSSHGRNPREKKQVTSKVIVQVPEPLLSQAKVTSKETGKTANRPIPDEISDSDTPPTPSPPRRRSHTKSPQTLKLTSPSSVAQSPALAPGAARMHLFSKITQAITTFPPTHDPRTLSWYEKILMYDPIVLEDLAAWLNTVGLGKVGVDEKVGPAVVRAWCEERSVCCLWKENLRGGTRSRY